MNKKYQTLVSTLVVMVVVIPLFSLTACVTTSNPDLFGVWGSSATDVFTVGESGIILHYDGSTWTKMLTDTDALLSDIWGTSSSDVFAVGEDGTILHYDGDTWSVMTTVPSSLGGIWGLSSSDVFAVGWNNDEEGVIWHYDGSAWSLIYTYSSSIGGIWGSSSSDLYAAAWDGILHYDGNEWSRVERTYRSQVGSIWGASASDVFATNIGAGYSILQYDGIEWSMPYTPGTSSTRVRSVWGSSSSNVFAVGGTSGFGPYDIVLHYDGNKWDEIRPGFCEFLADVWGSSATDVYAVGVDSTILHYDGKVWRPMIGNAWSPLEIPPFKFYTFTEVWASSPSDIFITTSHPSPSILHYDGTKWQSHTRFPDFGEIVDIWGSSPNNVFACTGGAALRYVLHYDGKQWSSMPGGGGSFRILGGSSNKVFTMAGEGNILCYDGNTWSLHFNADNYSEIDDPLRYSDIRDSLSSNNLAAGSTIQYYDGNTLYYDGEGWVLMESNNERHFHAVWGSSSTDVFAVGWSGEDKVIYHYDGSTWSLMYKPSPTSIGFIELSAAPTLNDIWGSSSSDVFAIGDDGTILHYDGDTWSKMDSGTDKRLTGIWGNSPSEVFVVGRDSTLLRYDGSSWSSIKVSK